MILEEDKTLHVLAGSIVASFYLCLGVSPAEAVLAAGVAGVAKELIWDRWWGKGDPDPADAVATLFGGVVAVALIQGLLGLSEAL